MSQLTHEQLGRGREAVREIRLGVLWNFAPVLLAAANAPSSAPNRNTLFTQPLDATIAQATLDRLLETLERDFELGRLLVTEGAMPLLGLAPEFELTDRVPLAPPPLRAIARPPPPDKLTLFDVRFVEEIGQGSGGLEVEFTAGARVETVTTNPIGAALLEEVASMSAAVGVVSSEALGEILEPRWDKPRAGSPPTGVNTRPSLSQVRISLGSHGSLRCRTQSSSLRYWGSCSSSYGTRPLECGMWSRVMKSLVPRASGKTDDKGRLVHEEVTRGDYKLALTVELDLSDGTTIFDTDDSPLVVLEAAAGEPEMRMLGVVPHVVMEDSNPSFSDEILKDFDVPPPARQRKGTYPKLLPTKGDDAVDVPDYFEGE